MAAFFQSALAFLVLVFTILHVLAVRDDDDPFRLPNPAKPDR